MTLFYFHEQCAAHDMGRHHPESPLRLQAVRDAVLAAVPAISPRTPAMASPASLERAHSTRHVERIFALAPAIGQVEIDADTGMMPRSLDAARYAAGALCGAVDALATNEADKAFCCVRPPGHHAERERAMGFCLFNNIAVAALQALDTHGMQRVAIVDFDVHHGNGTEDIFRDDPRVLVCSSYQYPLYPNCNSPSVAGQLINVPLAAGSGSDVFRAALLDTWWPELDAFAPDVILVSAGFDAHADDPLAGLELTDDDFRWLGETIGEAADRLCGGRVIAGLEGGYDLNALGRSAAAFCAALSGRPRPDFSVATPHQPN